MVFIKELMSKIQTAYNSEWKDFALHMANRKNVSM